MSRSSTIRFSFFIAIALIISSIQAAAFAEDGKGLENHLSIGIGWEQLDYEEQDRDTKSNAEVSNVILGIEGLKRWESVFCGIKAVIPVRQEDDEEVWTSSDKSLQTNTLEYRWMRVNSFVGYPLNHFCNPYVGLRWSESRQDREDFVQHGTIIPGMTREIVRSWSASLGVRGDGNFMPRWKWNYSIECFVPIDVQVTNSAIQGFEASDRGGYTVELRCGAKYSYTEALSLGLLIYGGRMHWDGSDWKPSPSGLVKWPENDTDYVGGTLNINWTF